LSNPASLSSADAIYQQRLEAAKAELRRLDAISARLANSRLAAFVGASVLALATVFGKFPGWGFGGALALLALYTAFAVRHAKVIRAEHTAQTLVLLNERGLLRLRGQWRDFPSQGERH